MRIEQNHSDESNGSSIANGHDHQRQQHQQQQHEQQQQVRIDYLDDSERESCSLLNRSMAGHASFSPRQRHHHEQHLSAIDNNNQNSNNNNSNYLNARESSLLGSLWSDLAAQPGRLSSGEIQNLSFPRLSDHHRHGVDSRLPNHHLAPDGGMDALNNQHQQQQPPLPFEQWLHEFSKRSRSHSRIS